MANQYRSVLASSGPAPTGGDALPAEVLSGKTFTNDNGEQTGTMTNNGAVTQTLTLGQSYNIPAGYHNGNGIIQVSEMMPSNVILKGYGLGILFDTAFLRRFSKFTVSAAVELRDASAIDNTGGTILANLTANTEYTVSIFAISTPYINFRLASGSGATDVILTLKP